MEREWSTREYQPGDEAGIVALWKEAFPEGESGRADLTYWNWQFRDPPAGFARIRVAVVDEAIVGHYAVIPVHMQVRGESVVATLSLDTMTHPEYQRQGIFTTLANELYAELGYAGFPITFGFPNDNSIGSFVRKLQWTYLCSLPVYVKPLRPSVIVDRIISSRPLAAVAKPLARLATTVVSRPLTVNDQVRASVRWLKQFDARADEVWQTAYDHRKIAVTRDAALLNWRYFLNPRRAYGVVAFEDKDQLVAYAVVRCMEQFGLRGGMITDLIGRPGRGGALQAVLAVAVEHFVEQRMDLAACLMYGDRRVARLLKRNGFLLVPRRAFKEWYFGVRVNNESVSPDLVNDPGNWYLTFGDTDII
jgi:GNAT superfamily N-acetyltransferase